MNPLLEIPERALDQLVRWQHTEDWAHCQQASIQAENATRR
ncbi:hypothetical protein [Stieleria bergensis]